MGVFICMVVVVSHLSKFETGSRLNSLTMLKSMRYVHTWYFCLFATLFEKIEDQKPNYSQACQNETSKCLDSNQMFTFPFLLNRLFTLFINVLV